MSSYKDILLNPLPPGVEPGKVIYRIVEDRKNPLLKRRELMLEIWHIGLPTPPRLEVRQKVAEMLGVDVNCVYIRHIYTEFGWGKSKVEVHVYEDPEFGKKIEPLYIQLRNMPKEEAEKIREELRQKKAEREEKKKRKKKKK